MRTRSVVGRIDGRTRRAALVAGIFVAVALAFAGRPARAATSFTDFGEAMGAGDTNHVAFGDVDDDGDLDLVVANFNFQTNLLYLNNGTANPFNGVTGTNIAGGGQSSTWVALGDMDGDGDLDLVVGNWQGTNTIVLNNGTADPFNGATNTAISADVDGTQSVALGDVDGDGDLDVVFGNFIGGRNRLHLNNGTADPFNGVTGTDITTDEHDTLGVALADVDGDGDLDLIAGNDNGANRLYLNNGTADPFNGVTGSDITADTNRTSSVSLGDMNGDGHLDLVAGSWGGVNRLYLNNGTADPFNGVSGSNITSDAVDTHKVALGDLDGDGDLDVVVANMVGEANRFYLNNGTAEPFNGVTGMNVAPEAEDTYGVAIGDVDGDGDLDIAVGNYSGQPERVYRNDSGVVNPVPSTPTGLGESVSGYGAADVTFSWSVSTDTPTPDASLTYNLRVGTTSEGDEVSPGHADSTSGW
ncbi:MAG: FG-GAP repeat domain-containing protein, partial [Planctomycetota bacterium]